MESFTVHQVSVQCITGPARTRSHSVVTAGQFAKCTHKSVSCTIRCRKNQPSDHSRHNYSLLRLKYSYEAQKQWPGYEPWVDTDNIHLIKIDPTTSRHIPCTWEEITQQIARRFLAFFIVRFAFSSTIRRFLCLFRLRLCGIQRQENILTGRSRGSPSRGCTL